MNRQKIWEEAKKQLAVDLACSPADFDQASTVFVPAADLPGRRPFPRKKPIFDMVSFGQGTVISGDADLLPQLRRQLSGLGRDSLWSQPFLRSLGHYFLPDPDRMDRLPLLDGLRWKIWKDFIRFQALQMLWVMICAPSVRMCWPFALGMEPGWSASQGPARIAKCFGRLA